ncbi:Hypothetical protein A7982_06014 [Minicystis rosea]|nr:Hypothetical protein A7982_06014 [Minicystis rosea]
MKLAVVGTGLVSPWGRSAREHAFFLRAGVIGPPRSPFVLRDDAPLKVRYCPWLGARTPHAERLADLAAAAIAEARASEILPPEVVFVCASRARGAAAIAAVENAFRGTGPMPRVERAYDEAGTFAALERIDQILTKQPRTTVGLVAVDSFVSLDALEALLDHAPSPFADRIPPPSEGAAALVITSPVLAREARVEVLGTIEHTALFTDAATDQNDDAVEARGMTTALERLPLRRPLRFVFGQILGGSLRRTEWHRATARAASRFDQSCEMRSIESEVGALGAAAGAANLVWGLSMLGHDTTELPAETGDAFVAWAISPDGTRGLAVASVEAR